MLQRSFIDFVVGPFYRSMAALLPGLATTVDQIDVTRAHWQSFADDAALIQHLAQMEGGQP